jgi:hypothetical protein
VASAIARLAPGEFDVTPCRHLFGTDRTVEEIKALRPPERIVGEWEADEEAFSKTREAYLLYD